jgi:hypothetical protein
MTTADTLAETMDETRNLTRFYLSKLNGEDMHRTFTIGDYTTNSPYWIIAHLIWAEHRLLVESLGSPKLDIPWLDLFAIGTTPAKENLPSLEEVLAAFKVVHEHALAHVRSMTDEQLAEENILNINFGGKSTKKFIAMHTIRHEGTHTGQLSLIAQFYGKKTV